MAIGLHLNLDCSLGSCIGQFYKRYLLIESEFFVLLCRLYDRCETRLDNMGR
jgi:hypothetical protein